VEVRYTRALAGKHSALYRGTLDKVVSDQDFEVAALADYRQAAMFYYQDLSRDKAYRRREALARKNGLSEIKWKLQHGMVDTSKRPPCDVDREQVRETEEDGQSTDEVLFPPAPRCSPCDMKKQSRPLRALKKQQSKRRLSNVYFNNDLGDVKDNVTTEGIEDSESSESSDNEEEKKRINRLKMLSFKPKQALSARLKCIRQRGRDRKRSQGSFAQADILLQSSEDICGGSRQGKSKSPAHVSFRGTSPAKGSSDEEGEHDADQVADLPEVKQVKTRSKVEHRASQVAEFLQWNQQDQQALRRIFDRYDANHSDTLDQSELATCLADIGLRGKNEIERSEIRTYLWSLQKLEVGFYEFATKVVPNIRKLITTLQQEKLHIAFKEADMDCSGMLSIQETLRQLKLMGTFPTEEQVKEAICRVRPEAAALTRSIDGSWLNTRDILDYDGFSLLIRVLEENTERERADLLRQLILEFSMSEEERESWQHNLVETHKAFISRVVGKGAMHGPQVVSAASAALVIRECGLAPRNPTQKHIMATIIGEEADNSGNIDFKTLIKIGERLRHEDRQWLHRIFHKHDHRQAGALTLNEVTHALGECGIRARTSHETAEIKSLIDEFDEDASGDVDQEEFVDLFRFVSEKLHKVQREVERQAAVRFGWSDKHFEDLRNTFMALDQDASEALEIHEMTKAVENLASNHLRVDINPVLAEVDVPQSSKGVAKIDFLTFMKIMKALEDRESMRLIAKRHGFEGESVNRLRAAFKELSPNEEMLVSRESLKHLLVDGVSESSTMMTEIQRELTNGHPAKVNFDVFVKFMKKKMDVGVARRSSRCIAD
jgi:Ca2+-binding EF-hand superfamily protein